MKHSMIYEKERSIQCLKDIERLAAISIMGLGERSEAAARVVYKRMRRKTLLEEGKTPQEAADIVKKEIELLTK